ncbi:MAG: prolyl oligopeptidase family serine peptidase [Bacteroidales bacterium]|nr:prolyl oligopeptidase family serine peptidase [Bacteroidales bacterium]
MKRILLFTALILTVSFASAQKKPLDHSVYDGWKSVGAFNMTEDGKYTIFMVNPQEGDNYLVSMNLMNFTKDSIARVNGPKMTDDGKFVAATIKPTFKQSRDARIKKVKPDLMPKDTLGIYNIQTKELKKIPYLKAFKIGRYGKDFIAFQTTPPADTSKSKKPVKKDKDEGENVMVYQLSTGMIDTLKFVSDYDFTKGGDSLFFATRPNSKDSINKPGLFLYIPKTKSITTLYNYHLKQSVKLPLVSEDNKHMAFYAKLDTTKNKDKFISIFYYNATLPRAKLVIDNNLDGMPEGMRVTENRSLQFNKEGNRLFFGISKILRERDTTLVDAELAKLDIWHYKDTYVQPYQLINLTREQRKSYVSVIRLDSEPKLVQLAKEEYEQVQVPNEWSADWAYAVSDYNYQLESQWSANPRRDVYLIDVNTGEGKLIMKDQYIGSGSPSPDANFLVWYNSVDKNWYSYEVKTGKTVCLTNGLNVSFTDEMHDSPDMARPYGHGGWAEGDAAFYLYDRYDIWQIDPKGVAPAVMLTDGEGRRNNMTFRIVRLDDILLPPGTPGVRMEPIKPKETIYFSAFDNVTKNNGYYFKEMGKRKPLMKQWVLEPVTFVYLNKAKKGDVITYVKHNFTNSPDVWVTKDNFKTQTKVTDINPQQRDYNWGTAELVKWKSKTGLDVEGILHKPENFDPTKKYPMIVYFYETITDNLHSYRAPAPSRSTINITYFTSNGYLVFTPDIYYQIGYPGKSAMDCIVPGVEKICENPWADRDNVAIQGQSWGGYQVAYMVTQPEIFKWKAAGAGAPVANMTSAYGGIRWGSGMVRQFQYEHTQSRIGKTLWDGFDLYIENSPLFFANKVETPLLIMHNDEDDAVPWYQGIEYFTALRRLGKPVWMLQYNKEKHNLVSRVNAKDLSVRLSQFFDHYLKGAPMPTWMDKGVPAVLKGIDWGL